MNKKIRCIKIGLFLVGLWVLLPLQMQAQDFSLSPFEISDDYVTENFVVSPNKKLLAYSTLFFTESGLDAQVYIHDLEKDTMLVRLPRKMAIHSWLDDEHIILGSPEINQYFIINIQTLATDSIEGISSDADLVKLNKSLSVFFQNDDETIYYVQKGKKNQKHVQKDIISNFFYDAATDKILELHAFVNNKKCYTNIFSYHPETNKRKIIAKIPMITNNDNSFMQHIRLHDDKLYFIESIFTTEAELRLSFLCVYDLKKKKRTTLYAFPKGVDCEHIDVISAEKFVVLIKDHKLDEKDKLKETEVEDVEMSFDFSAELMLLEKKEN